MDISFLRLFYIKICDFVRLKQSKLSNSLLPIQTSFPFIVMASVIKYVGRTTDFKGKTLWEIVGSLKNQGKGRIVIRSMFQRYKEPTYMKIVKVETCPNEEIRKVRVWVEKVFRGNETANLVEIHSTSYKADYQLVPKQEEHKYLENKLVHNLADVVLPKSIEMPPLMKKFIMEDQKRKNLSLQKEYVMPIKYNWSYNRLAKIAQPEEQPTVKFTIGIGTPASPSLYEGIDLKQTQ